MTLAVNFTHPLGIHLRPSAMLAAIANRYNSQLTIHHDGKKADLKSILDIMSLGCSHGQVVLEAVGLDAVEALAELKAAFDTNFDEFI